jgi:nucleotide-binding universal stress UspA family protein
MKAKKVHSISERGEPAEALITVAEERGGDLIVVGSRGMSSPSRFLLGNVPNKVSHHAPCDVIIVHTTN